MNDLKLVFGFGAAMAVVFMAEGCAKAVAQEEERKPDRAIELTIYKDDFAMVSERRPVTIESGHSNLVIEDISKHLDPNSVLFDWQNPKDHPHVAATTYNLGLGGGTNLLNRLSGQEVGLMWPSNDGKPGEWSPGDWRFPSREATSHCVPTKSCT